METLKTIVLTVLVIALTVYGLAILALFICAVVAGAADENERMNSSYKNPNEL